MGRSGSSRQPAGSDGVARRSGRARGRGVPLETWLRRRRSWRWGYGLVAVALLLSTVFADRQPARLAQLERVELEVVEIVDARTLRLARPDSPLDQAVTVRLAGIDIDGPWAVECERQLARHAAGRRVRMSWRQRLPENGGQAYVYLEDGTLLNAFLIESGHARAATRRTLASTHRLTDWFRRLESRASQGDRGLWVELAENTR